MKNLKVAIIGAGKVGAAIASDFYEKRIHIEAIIDKEKTKAKRLAQKVGSSIYSDHFSSIPSSVNLFIISVQDRFVFEVAKDIANIFSNLEGKFAFHTSGALSSEELNPLKEKNCEIFSLHPNFSFLSNNTSKQSLIKFNECVFAIESNSRKAIAFAKKLCKILDYEFIELKSEQKLLYHIFSVIISNYTVTEFYQVEKFFGKKLIKSYIKLLKSTIQNIEEFGANKSLTGPIIREDIQTIQKHLSSLSKIDKNLMELYKKFGQLTIKMIENDLKKGTRNNLKKLLS